MMDYLNMTEADELGADKRNFTRTCQSEINRVIAENQKAFNNEIKPLTVEDINSTMWNELYKRSKIPCMDVTLQPPFKKDTRKVYYNQNIYYLPTKTCIENCSGRGSCVLGRCTCNNGWYGDYCQFQNCYNSLVYVDIDTINP